MLSGDWRHNEVRETKHGYHAILDVRDGVRLVIVVFVFVFYENHRRLRLLFSFSHW